MTIRYAGGETRDTVRCKDCRTKRRPLKWYDLWEAWLCPHCTETRIAAELTSLA